MTQAPELTKASQSVRGLLRWDDRSKQGQTLHLREGDTIQMGREADNDVILDSLYVSRRHAVLVWRGEAFELADLGSMNGTQVNGERVTQPRILHDGDVIQFYDVEVSYQELEEAAAKPEAAYDANRTFVVPPTTPQPHFIVSAGCQEGLDIPLRSGKMVIGRATAKDTWGIALQDRSISRPHAQLEQVDGDFMLTDLGSANGVLVNGVCLIEPAVLHDGDVIVLGETTLLFRAR